MLSEEIAHLQQRDLKGGSNGQNSISEQPLGHHGNFLNAKENHFINVRQGGLKDQKENPVIIFDLVESTDCTGITCKLKTDNF